MFKWLRALVLRRTLPRCPTCDALVAKRGEFCGDECDRTAAMRQAMGF